jgi:hypothetical protein
VVVYAPRYVAGWIMKKLWFVAAAFALLISVPAVSLSQGFSSFALPSGLFGGPSPFSSGSRPDGMPWLDPLSFYAGWGEPVNSLVFAFDGQLGASVGLRHRWAVRGVWLGVAEKINFSERCGVGVEAWWLVPSTARGSEDATFTRILFIAVPSGDEEFPFSLVPFTVTGPQGQSWNTFPDWWYIDGRLMAKPIWRDFDLLAGFRYDHFSTRFEFPFDPFGDIPSSSSDRSDITVNSYIPYVGFQYNSVGSASNLCMRLIGFPWVPATVQHFQTGEAGAGIRAESNGNFNRRGYFLEFFGEYSRTVFGDAGLGGWLRWNVLSGAGIINTTIRPGELSGSDTFTFTRNTIAFGAKATLNFNFPY